MTEAVTVKSPSHEEDFDDVGCNADLLYIHMPLDKIKMRFRSLVVMSDHNATE